MTAPRPLVVGIFVGGRGSRMGGVAKGLLKAPDSEATLVERLYGEVTRATPEAAVVLVGDASAYAALGVAAVQDEPLGVGPLGGLLGLLTHAERHGACFALALACDLPHLGAEVIARLATEASGASALITITAGVRNPLLTRYAVATALPAARAVLGAGKRSLQAVLDELGAGVVTLELSEAEAATLGDWDTPEDMR